MIVLMISSLFLLIGSSQAISNGIKAEDGQFPYSVAILANFSGLIDSGAVLISDQYVLSWVTTFLLRPNATTVRLAFGTNDLYTKKPWRVDMDVNLNDIIFLNDTYDNDIAIVKLPRPIEFSEYIQPIQLPSWAQVNETFDDINITIIGYGINNDFGENILHYGNTTTLSNSECASKAQFPIYPNEICSSSSNRVQVCLGDYGGPMFMEDQNGNMTLIGVASATFSLECGSDLPVDYTRITNYLQFIADNTNVIIRDS